ncbi:vWA domain-containing protein [Coraliomargarita parva]|uniref:vWA domain-containing protein n=1 Tax=Coraliomargarita parva TaxID=3014050 RepID=UPI0022B44F3C|nr:VWA domain-containing protein [Coraliomargarita parva]
MNVANSFSRNKALTLVIGISVGLHVVALLIFGAFKIVEAVVREEQTFEAPPIEQAPQQEPEYVVNLEQRTQSSSPPRPNPITVDSPDVSIPALNIDVNIDAASSYGRGAGGFGTGAGTQIRDMVMSSFEFFGKKMGDDAEDTMFIVDISGSMVMGSRGIDGFKAVADEILKTLKNMEGFGSFNIIAFAKETDSFRSSFQPVTPETIEMAERWLEDMDPAKELRKQGKKPDGKYWKGYNKGIHQNTRMDLALEAAIKKRPKLIILLSDGEPTAVKDNKGKTIDLYEFVADLQKGKNIPINTLSYKSKDGRGFLKKLAEQNSGTYGQVE